MVGWVEDRIYMDEWEDGWVGRREGRYQKGERMDGWMDEWMDFGLQCEVSLFS